MAKVTNFGLGGSDQQRHRPRLDRLRFRAAVFEVDDLVDGKDLDILEDGAGGGFGDPHAEVLGHVDQEVDAAAGQQEVGRRR